MTKEMYDDNFGDQVKITSFNSKDINLSSNGLFENKVLSAAQILEQLTYLDTNPPYQRGKVWKTPYQQELIRSILRGLPINTIHFVKKGKTLKDNHLKWVLDGKQRIDTLKSFANNEFAVSFELAGEEYNVTWSDIMNPDHECHSLMSKIQEFQIQVVMWQNMPVKDQRDIFIIINYSKSLNNDEKLYCENFLVQKILKFFLKEMLSVISPFLNKKIIDDYRFAGLRMLHSILILAYGSTLNDQFAPRELSAEKIRNSCKDIEYVIEEANLDASMSLNDVNNIPIFKKVLDDVKIVCEWFKKSINFKNDLSKGKKFEHNAIVDILVLFLKKKAEGILTTSYVNQNLSQLHKFIIDWVTYKNDNGDKLKKRSTQQGNVKIRFESIETIFNNSGIDIDFKNKEATAHEKLLASLAANSECPVLNCKLTDDNVQFDHVDPKSVFGSTNIVAISDIANNLKSNQTSETLKNISNYAESNQK